MPKMPCIECYGSTPEEAKPDCPLCDGTGQVEYDAEGKLLQGAACSNHVGRAAECPQAHICVCSAPLASHYTVETYCPGPRGERRSSRRYRPNAATLARFPEQYEHTGPPSNGAIIFDKVIGQ